MSQEDAVEQLAADHGWTTVQLVNRGWSADTKYHLTDATGQELLLRLATVDKAERKRYEFECLTRVSRIKVPCPRPIEFGTTKDMRFVYSILTWIPGADAETVLTQLDERKQFDLGVQAGSILRKIHTLEGVLDDGTWTDHYRRKIDRVVRWYEDCSHHLPYGDAVIAHVHANVGLLRGRPIRQQHGDFHTGSLIVTPEGTIGVIDFNRCSYGDPWEEYDRYVFTWSLSAPFANGQLAGYFGGRPPDEFFGLMSLYNAVNMLASLPWAVPFGDAEIETMVRNCNAVFKSYDGFNSSTPDWYRETA